MRPNLAGREPAAHEPAAEESIEAMLREVPIDAGGDPAL
jgi:hypothetical protein